MDLHPCFQPALQAPSFPTMDDLTFLNEHDGCYGSSNAIMKIVLPSGLVDHISDRVSPHRLLDRCPLLYHVFEYGHQSRLQASIEAPSRTAAIALLRYCYTGSYLPPGLDSECAPITFLLHVEMYKMAEDFDIPELQLLAHGNFSCQIDCACCLPCPPQDVLETIRYVYAHLSSPQARQQADLVQTLLNYCVCVFQYQKLGANAHFLQLVREIPEFHQDLCRANLNRNFEDDCAPEIVQLAPGILHPQHGTQPTTLASRDLPSEMLIDRPATPPRAIVFDPVRDAMSSNKTESSSDGSDLEDSAISFVAPGPSTLALRPKMAQSTATTGFDAESSSEDEGFSIVHRPKPVACLTPDDPMSSPEIIPSNPRAVDMFAIAGNHIDGLPNEDDWDLFD